MESIKSDDSYEDWDVEGLGLGSDGSSQAVESIKSNDSYEDWISKASASDPTDPLKLWKRLKVSTVTRIWISKASTSGELSIQSHLHYKLCSGSQSEAI